MFQVADNHFAHFFAPQNLTNLNKNVVFVIDISSSMEGQKVKQVNCGSKQLASRSFFSPITHPTLVLPPESGFGISAPGQRQGNLTGYSSSQGLWNQPLSHCATVGKCIHFSSTAKMGVKCSAHRVVGFTNGGCLKDETCTLGVQG